MTEKQKKMAFSKKDEDVHDALMKVDRTSVFQEGKQATSLTSQIMA